MTVAGPTLQRAIVFPLPSAAPAAVAQAPEDAGPAADVHAA